MFFIFEIYSFGNKRATLKDYIANMKSAELFKIKHSRLEETL